MPILSPQQRQDIQARKRMVFTFGRFNPPTIGHQVVVNKILEIARQQQADAMLIPTQTQNPRKDPLKFIDKVAFLKAAFPNIKVSENTSIRTIFDAVQFIFDEGYKEAVLIVGSDRVGEMTTMLTKYVGIGKDIPFEFFHVESAGARDADADGAKGMSASKMREFAKNKNFRQFRLGVPATFSTHDAKLLYYYVRRGMGLA